jgi:hypothetical protein
MEPGKEPSESFELTAHARGRQEAGTHSTPFVGDFGWHFVGVVRTFDRIADRHGGQKSLNARLHPATNFPNGEPVKRFVQLVPEAWGYKTPDLEPREIVEQLVNEVRGGIATYRIVSIDFERATSRDGYQRVYVEMPISMELPD